MIGTDAESASEPLSKPRSCKISSSCFTAQMCADVFGNRLSVELGCVTGELGPDFTLHYSPLGAWQYSDLGRLSQKLLNLWIRVLFMCLNAINAGVR